MICRRIYGPLGSVHFPFFLKGKWTDPRGLLEMFLKSYVLTDFYEQNDQINNDNFIYILHSMLLFFGVI